jgi:hypothetical protein
VGKNRDGKTGKTTLYFDYPRSRTLTNEEYMDEFGEVMKIYQEKKAEKNVKVEYFRPRL